MLHVESLMGDEVKAAEEDRFAREKAILTTSKSEKV